MVKARTAEAGIDDLPIEVRLQRGVSIRPKRERRRTVADDLYRKLREDQGSFWTAVYPLYMQREITKENVRELVRKGTRGGARQLPHRREAVQHGAPRLQAVSQLPPQARLPAARSRSTDSDAIGVHPSGTRRRRSSRCGLAFMFGAPTWHRALQPARCSRLRPQPPHAHRAATSARRAARNAREAGVAVRFRPVLRCRPAMSSGPTMC